MVRGGKGVVCLNVKGCHRMPVKGRRKARATCLPLVVQRSAVSAPRSSSQFGSLVLLLLVEFLSFLTANSPVLLGNVSHISL